MPDMKDPQTPSLQEAMTMMTMLIQAQAQLVRDMAEIRRIHNIMMTKIIPALEALPEALRDQIGFGKSKT